VVREIDPRDGAGQRLGGRYRLLRPLGSGGMSVVWRAYDEVLRREVAVKVLAPASDPAASIEAASARAVSARAVSARAEAASVSAAAHDRIRAEAQSAARLAHPHITSVFDYGEAKGPRGARVPYVVMELLDGASLAARLRAGPLPWPETVRLCAEIASALAAAHARGVVHRDVKPANIMLTSTGAKVVDFGIAGLAGSPGDAEANEPVLGTPAYLAPERLIGEPVVAATDVYGLGMLLYRCLAGRLPWHVETMTQMITAHVVVPPDPLPPVPDLPDEVAVLCTRCLAKEPDDRPSAAEVARVLGRVAGIKVTLPADEPPLLGQFEVGQFEVSQFEVGQIEDGTDAATAKRRVGYVRHPLVRRRVVVRASAAVLGLACAAALVGWLADFGQPGGATAASACDVHFLIRPEGAGSVRGLFGARVVLANTGAETLQRWALEFEFQGDEWVTEVQGADFKQVNRVLELTGAPDLPAGKAAIIGVWGNVAKPLGPPQKFRLDGATCPSQEYEIGPNEQPWPAPVAITDPPSFEGVPRRRPPGPDGRRGGPGGGPGPSRSAPDGPSRSSGILPSGPPGRE
jgi:serine/threonine-protein kinase